MAKTLNEIITIINSLKGKEISYRALTGRRKSEFEKGIIKGTYPNIFTIYLESQKITKSFRYIDLLSGEVEIFSEPDKNPII